MSNQDEASRKGLSAETGVANRFDPENLRLSQNFNDVVGVRRHLTTVPVRKPGRQDFVRVHPGSDYRIETAVLEFKEERETYLVDPELWHALPGELIPKVLYTCINRQNVLTLWPIRLPGQDGRVDNWNASALEAAQLACHGWVRVAANMSLGAYEIYEASGTIPDPDWPEASFTEILQIAFRDRYISDLNHSAIKRLRGEA